MTHHKGQESLRGKWYRKHHIYRQFGAAHPRINLLPDYQAIHAGSINLSPNSRQMEAQASTDFSSIMSAYRIAFNVPPFIILVKLQEYQQ